MIFLEKKEFVKALSNLAEMEGFMIEAKLLAKKLKNIDTLEDLSDLDERL